MSQDVRVEGEGIQTGRVNYIIGHDPTQWRTHIPTYRAVVYREAYPGIDLKFYGNNRRLEYDVVVKPGSDPSLLRLGYSGIEGFELKKGGDFHLRLKQGGELVQQKPVAYQEIAGRKVPVQANLKVFEEQAEGTQESVWVDEPLSVGFELGPYDQRYTLVIDPTLVYSTFLGGDSGDWGYAAALDSAGHCYVAGSTASADFPTKNPYQGTLRGGTYGFDAFVTQFDAQGTGLVYSTYLGGSDDDYAGGNVVNTLGQCYVAGRTASTDFPMEVAYQDTYGGGSSDVFVTQFNAAGNGLVYSTYLGGSGNDQGGVIAIDGKRRFYVAGDTSSTDFPVKNACQGSLGGMVDAFVAGFNSEGWNLIYATYLGGSSVEYARGVAANYYGNAYLVGWTSSTDFPTENPTQDALRGVSDAFVAKLSGNTLVYSTYLGGDNADAAHGVVADHSGNCYVVGETHSTSFPTENPYQSGIKGSSDAFVTKLGGFAPPLVADFTGEPATGTVPYEVRFTDLSSGTITSWDWAFGDDSANSTVQNPRHIYGNPGSYTVALTVTGPGGTDTKTRTGYIEALPCPYKPVRIGEKYYDLIEDAYQDASQGDTVQCQAMAFDEDLVFDRNISLTIMGGYDCDYTTRTGHTCVRSLVIRNGVITVENLSLTSVPEGPP